MGATNPNAGGAPGGGGKGGMGMNRGPLGNAQNNPGAPRANYGMGMKPMPSPQQLGINPQQLDQSLQGLGISPPPQYGGGFGFGRPQPSIRQGLFGLLGRG